MSIDNEDLENEDLENEDSELENWKRVWQCRDFELSHLWQRSIFLTAFLILIYTGYGTFMIELLKCKVHIKSIHHIIAMGMCALGIIFSLLWIMMGKGSKYWYECYESKINELEEGNEYLNAHNVGHLMKENSSHSICSTKGGKFSVSSINILIGQVSLVVWGILLSAHTVYLIILNSKVLVSLIVLLLVTFIMIMCILIIRIYREVERPHNKYHYLSELHDILEQHLEERKKASERKKIRSDLKKLIKDYAELHNKIDIDKCNGIFKTTTEKDLKKYERKFKTLKTKFEELT